MNSVTGANGADSWRWILIAKGMGIFLVVIGHLQPDYAPAWWRATVELIYTFHMPLFFLISGYLYVYGKRAWSSIVKSKLWRLGLPFVTIGAIFFSLKLVAGHFVELNHPVGPHSLRDLFLNPAVSFMPLLWFMHALFLMFLFYPLLRIALRHNAWILLVLIVINTLWPSDDLPGLARVLAHAPFFVAGIWLRESGQMETVHGTSWIRIGSIALLLFVLASMWSGVGNAHFYPLRFFLGVTGAIAVIALSRCLDLTGQSGIATLTAQVGFYSMTIYLLHTLFASGIRVSAFQLAELSTDWFIPVAILAILAGILGPWLLEKHVLRKLTVTRVGILGLRARQDV